MPSRNENGTRLSIYAKVGICFSIIIGAGLAVYFAFMWSAIEAMKPNEFGDLLAGILGPLALLWLVLGFFQQSDELRQSVWALKLQSEELRNSVVQQSALVEVTREQAAAERSLALATLLVEHYSKEIRRLERDSSGGPGGALSTNALADLSKKKAALEAAIGQQHDSVMNILE
ncbi:MAG: hypothetical protein WAT93_00565 [Pontixanthobacter sp.]